MGDMTTMTEPRQEGRVGEVGRSCRRAQQHVVIEAIKHRHGGWTDAALHEAQRYMKRCGGVDLIRRRHGGLTRPALREIQDYLERDAGLTCGGDVPHDALPAVAPQPQPARKRYTRADLRRRA